MDTSNFRQWLTRTNRSQNTVRMYVGNVNRYLESGLTPTEWITREKEYGASASSIKMMLASIRAYHKFTGTVDSELSEYIPPSLPQPDPHPLPGGLDDVRRCLELPMLVSHRTAIALGAFAGTRAAETISLTQSDIRSGSLYIKGKGERYRIVPISDELAMHLDYVETDRLVPLQNASVRKAITNAFRRAGVKGHNGENVSSHDLRATFATAVYQKTNDIVMVQRLLGHSQVTQTQNYLGISRTDMENAVKL